MRIATWNVNSLRVRLPHVLDWLQASAPDVLGLQEIKQQNDEFPETEIDAAGYQAIVNGQRTYNGVALLSRLPGSEVLTDLPGFDDPQRRFVAATYGDTRVINIYVPNGQALDSDKFVYKMAWLQALYDYLKKEIARYPRLLVMGDYNIAPEDRDVHDPAAWEGSVHVSPPEREALSRLFSLGLSDVFRNFPQADGTYSWWDYRRGAFRRNNGLRIDLILATDALAKDCRRCDVDIEPRAWVRPSDHTPVVADFAVE
jgi:exodeoxyribonuclease-3